MRFAQPRLLGRADYFSLPHGEIRQMGCVRRFDAGPDVSVR